MLGCGVDLERPARFERYVDPHADVWPLVFSQRELDHARGLGEPQRALCAAFCAKEAFTKALREPFEYAECELLLEPTRERQDVLLDAGLVASHSIARCEALVTWPNADECLVVLYLFGTAEPGPGA